MESTRKVKPVNLEEATAVGFGTLSCNTDHDFDFVPFKYAPLDSDEVRVKLLYTGLCHTDIMWATGKWGFQPEQPCVPGHEVVGEITDLGSDVTDFKVGDKVGYTFVGNNCESCDQCKQGNDNLCTDCPDKIIFGNNFGGWSSHYTGKAKQAHKIPDGLDLSLTPPIFCAGLTVYVPLKRYVKEGDHVAIVGIGGLGHLAIKYAKIMGCKVTAITGTLDKVEELKAMGADTVLTYDQLADAQKTRDIDFVLCCISGGKIAETVKILRIRGIYCMVGLPTVEDNPELPVNFIVLNEINFVGSLVGNRAEMAELLEFSLKHKVYPDCEIFGFDQFGEACQKLHYGRPKYRAVVKMESEKYSKLIN